MKLYLYFLLALSLLTAYACDPIFTGYWYLENQLDENIIVTRSDSKEQTVFWFFTLENKFISVNK